MSKELEIEFKNLLTEDEYQNLLERFGRSTADAKTQINHYFDTADFQLRKQHSALRIRQKGSTYECTLKIPATNGYYEITDKLQEQQAQQIFKNYAFPAPEVAEALQELGISPDLLHLLGSLTTHRIEFPYQSGLLVLDHSEYMGTADYELEYEVADFDEGKQRFERFLAEHGLPFREADKKIARFMDAAKKYAESNKTIE